jgi:uncharacterized protein YjbI with pentapeptide repeats
MKWAAMCRRRLHDPGPPQLWKIGYALAAFFAVTLAALVVLGWTALALLHHPRLPYQKTISVHDAIGVAQLVFASVAGAGALVALVVAYRRQRVTEANSVHDRERWQVTASHDRARVLNERFTATAAQLGNQNAAVRLAGVHAMAGLADDWEENRQTCIDVLCAYLRMPYEPEPADEAPAAEQLAFRASREVRHTIIRVITARLQKDAAMSWHRLNFDFTGVVFDGGDFSGAVFTGGRVLFREATFLAGDVVFADAVFSGGFVSFVDSVFSGATVRFYNLVCSGATVRFNGAVFSGGDVIFLPAVFSGGEVSFDEAVFSGAGVGFGQVTFSGGEVRFHDAVFAGGEIHFDGSEFSSGTVSFNNTRFSGGKVYFDKSEFSGGTVSFNRARFSGGEAYFGGAVFSGGKVDFSRAEDWSHPPKFGWEGTPPQGVKLPVASGCAPL